MSCIPSDHSHQSSLSFPWQQPVQRSRLFQSTLSRGQRVLLQCTAAISYYKLEAINPVKLRQNTGKVTTMEHCGTYAKPLLQWKIKNAFSVHCWAASRCHQYKDIECCTKMLLWKISDAVLYCRPWPVWLHHVFPHYLINGTIFGGKKTQHKNNYKQDKSVPDGIIKVTEVWLHIFLASPLDGGEWSTSRHSRFNPKRE